MKDTEEKKYIRLDFDKYCVDVDKDNDRTLRIWIWDKGRHNILKSLSIMQTETEIFISNNEVIKRFEDIETIEAKKSL